jgi:hypothetical protein
MLATVVNPFENTCVKLVVSLCGLVVELLIPEAFFIAHTLLLKLTTVLKA